jgi:hypothetical protein
MSGTGNCFDNALMESFWGTLKQELVHHRHYATRQQAMRDITEYIEIITGSADRKDWDSCLRRHMPRNSMLNSWRYERVGVYF